MSSLSVEGKVLPPTDNLKIKLPRQIGYYLIIQLLLIIALEACLAAMLFFIAPLSFSQEIPNQSTTSKLSNINIHKIINNNRHQYNLKPLTIDPLLQQAANNKADDIMANKYFSHTSPEGRKFSSWIKEVEYPYLRVGENLAIHYTNSEDVVKAWMNSEKHRRNILNPYYSDTGIAIRKGKFGNKNTVVVVQLFGQESTSYQNENYKLTLTTR